MTMESNDLLRDILIHTDTGKLKQFVNEYANDHADFRDVFLEKFSPKPKPKPGSKHKQPEEDYPRIIKKAFDEGGSRSHGKYRNDYYDIGFDAEAVSNKLEPLLDKARYYLRHDNREEAIHIAQNLIDTIPDYWDENFDYEGDVQVIYDEAIDLLEDILNDEPTTEQMELIFSWYEKVNGDKKHQYMGLNSSLEQLERYFAADAAGGFERVLRIVDKRIAISEEYEKERAVVEKIYLLEENNREAAADQTIEQYLFFPDVRAIRLKRLLTAERYDDAIRLLQEGIEIAREKKTIGTVNDWQKELLSIYTRLNNHAKIVEITKELFVEGREQRACYQSLRKLTPEDEWPDMLTWILQILSEKRYYDTGELRADIYVEHKRWDDLLHLCHKSGIGMIRKYEKHLRPRYPKEVFSIYLQYVQQQATITDKEAYKRVGQTLIWMKSFEGGTAVVRELINQFRETYKRRPYMMKELDRVF